MLLLLQFSYTQCTSFLEAYIVQFELSTAISNDGGHFLKPVYYLRLLSSAGPLNVSLITDLNFGNKKMSQRTRSGEKSGWSNVNFVLVQKLLHR